MNILEKFQTPILFIAIVTGLLLGNIAFVERYAENFVMPFLFVMLFGVFLNTPVRDFRRAFRNIKFSVTTVLINFVWTPLLIFLLGKIFLANSFAMQLGLVMLMVTPCTDWYLVFTGTAKGNVPLSASVLPVNLILQIVLLPVYLYIMGSVSGTVNIQAILSSILFMLIIPFGLAQALKVLLRKFKDEERKEKILSIFTPLQTILLALAIAAMFASKGNILLANLNIIAKLLIPIILFYIINFILAQIIGKVFQYSYENTASLTLTTIAKNSPMTLGIALMAFPNEPVIHLIMLIEPLIELPCMLLITRILLILRTKNIEVSEE
ncbi:arsenic resistance protein [Konateibacter massiliensis]|uniref:arsenic resistance protein n=1 Tax=Konateibacter massiliensis TaxID=2002841 RepID=UPI000C14E3E3|nr:arsenic resistance protein [Konateibacter massiliensis]